MVDAADQLGLDAAARGRAGVGVSLVAALHGAQRMEGLDDRRPGGQARRARSAAQPDIQKWACTTSGGSASQRDRTRWANAGMCCHSSSFGDGPGGAGLDVVDGDAGRASRRRSGSPRASARVDHRHLATERGEPGGELRDVHVLAARIGPAHRGERAGVLGHEVDAQAPHRPASGGSPSRSGSGACRRQRLEPIDGSHHVVAAHGAEAHLLVERAGAAAAAGARDVLRAEHEWGTRHGRQRSSGTVGGNSATTGVPTAAARCIGPVFPTTTAAAPKRAACRAGAA